MSSVVIVGTDGPFGRRLGTRYRDLGHEVATVALDGQELETLVLDLPPRIDLVIFVDDYDPPHMPPEDVTREALRAGLDRLTFTPFRLAALMKGALVAGKGRLVLLTRRTGMVALPDEAHHYLDRPFRAAAHALWRCLAVEWQDSGIHCALVAVESVEEVTSLPDVIAQAPHGVLVDARIGRLGW